MASSAAAAGRLIAPLLFLLLIQLGSLSVSVAGRPCKTLFVASYRFSIRRLPTVDPKPNPTGDVVFLNLPTSDPSFYSSSSSGFVTIFTAAFPAVQVNPQAALSREVDVRSSESQQPEEQRKDEIFGSFDYASLRERSLDIVNVVLSLLFGVGCGALTAATMYMAWYVITNGGGSYLQESDDEYDSDESPKKMGYIKIHAPDPTPVPSKA
ncbi:hypothetical protein SAY86_032017 [Trapa natans]|uniref:Uncharacterized protein n=1 Tax=Trapa natans TaxID=22666 RepID=A0AAN7LTR0_TRANT|nr:hypothetical protein SAY86_032017 [Trapa natans]